MKIRHLDVSTNPTNQEHQQLGLPPLEDEVTHADAHPLLRLTGWLILFILIGVSALFITRLIQINTFTGSLTLIQNTLTSTAFWSAFAVGLFAQMIDGALGMAYGITATTFLLTTGASPAVASASVHVAEIFTTGLSGLSHLKFGNINRQLFFRLLVPGMIGSVVGAVLVTQIDGKALKPYIAIYLLCMGIYILRKAFQARKAAASQPKHVGKLALLGGFVDASGGGGWGPVVTTTLLGGGSDPRTTIGSVNLAEFFLTIVTAAVFTLLAESGIWSVVAGLVLGGALAAPFAAYLCRHFTTRTLLLLVGTLIIVTSSFNLWRAL